MPDPGPGARPWPSCKCAEPVTLAGSPYCEKCGGIAPDARLRRAETVGVPAGATALSAQVETILASYCQCVEPACESSTYCAKCGKQNLSAYGHAAGLIASGVGVRPVSGGLRGTPPVRDARDGYIDHKVRMGAYHAKNGIVYFLLILHGLLRDRPRRDHRQGAVARRSGRPLGMVGPSPSPSFRP